jgi:hypothetical protein
MVLDGNDSGARPENASVANRRREESIVVERVRAANRLEAKILVGRRQPSFQDSGRRVNRLWAQALRLRVFRSPEMLAKTDIANV